MTAQEIAAAILNAEGIEDASKEDVQAVAQGIQHSLRTMRGKASRLSARLGRPVGC